MAEEAATRPAAEATTLQRASRCRRRRRLGRFGAVAAPALVLLVIAAAMVPLCLGRAAATAGRGPPLLRRPLGWVVKAAPANRRRPPRLQQLSAWLGLIGDECATTRRRSRRLAPLAAEVSGAGSAGKKACLVGNMGVESPYKGQPPAYRHLVYPGNDTAAEAAAFHRDWGAEARFRLRVRVAPTQVALSASIAAARSGDSPLLLMAEGELVRLPMPMEGDDEEGARAGMDACPRTVWKTRAWVGDGEGRREATYELITQGMAAAQSLGAQHLSLDVACSQLAQELTEPATAVVEGPTTPRLLSLHEKVRAARERHFPGAAFSVVVEQEEGLEEEEEEEEEEDGEDGVYHIQGDAIKGLASLGAVVEGQKSAARMQTLARELWWAATVSSGERSGAQWVQTWKKNQAKEAAAAEGKRSPAGSSRGLSSSASSSASSFLPAAAKGGRYLLRFDGGSRGNPGPSGAGIVLYEEKGGQRLEEVMADALWLGASGTNNEAEYKGLIAGLQAAKRIGVKHLCVEGDSQLVVRQMLGQYKVKTQHLKPLHAEAQALARHFDPFEIRHIERALNSRADALANQALDRAAEISDMVDSQKDR